MAILGREVQREHASLHTGPRGRSSFMCGGEARLCPPVSINQHEDALDVTPAWNPLEDPAQLLLPHWLRWQLPVGRAAPQQWCGTLARPLCAWAQSPPCLSHRRLLLSGLLVAPCRDRLGKRPREGAEVPRIDCRRRSSSWREALASRQLDPGNLAPCTAKPDLT